MSLRSDQREQIDQALQQCGPHDFGLNWAGCTCYGGDPRPLLAAAMDEITQLECDVENLTAERDKLISEVVFLNDTLEIVRGHYE